MFLDTDDDEFTQEEIDEFLRIMDEPGRIDVDLTRMCDPEYQRELGLQPKTKEI